MTLLQCFRTVLGSKDEGQERPRERERERFGEGFGLNFGRFGGSEGVLGGLLGGLGKLLGGLGGILGGPEAVLGRLGSSWVVKGHFGVRGLRQTAAFGRPKGGQDEAKIGPRRPKIEDKNEVEKRRS